MYEYTHIHTIIRLMDSDGKDTKTYLYKYYSMKKIFLVPTIYLLRNGVKENISIYYFPPRWVGR